jgi:hypothetical protein
LDNVTLYGGNLLSLRCDYGSTWEGTVKITDCKWIINDDGQKASQIFDMQNNGMHDLCYTCHMPEVIEKDNLYIDDFALEGTMHELFLFEDPCAGDNGESLPPFEERPYPYILCREVTCRNLMTASKRTVHTSKNEKLFSNVKIDM